MINWFKSISNKTKARFIKLDIVEFYPSITEKLLDVIFYAQTLTIIPDEKFNLLNKLENPYFLPDEKRENALSDVTMGSQDRAEVCEVIGIYLLGKL